MQSGSTGQRETELLHGAEFASRPVQGRLNVLRTHERHHGSALEIFAVPSVPTSATAGFLPVRVPEGQGEGGMSFVSPEYPMLSLSASAGYPWLRLSVCAECL